jgi:ketosteroid isomerase-like protein
MSTQTSTQENKQLLKTIFDALAQGQTRPFTDAMAEDFRWRFAGEWSWARDWGHTKSEVRDKLLRPLMAQFADYRASAQEIIADADRVVVRAIATATTSNGDAYPQAYCYVFRVERGRLSEVLEYCDTALVERVLTVPEQPSANDGAPSQGT